LGHHQLSQGFAQPMTMLQTAYIMIALSYLAAAYALWMMH
jgi:hypothetical protein